MEIQARIKAVLDREVVGVDPWLAMRQPKLKVMFRRHAGISGQLARDYIALRTRVE
jgi:hypothetical protein